MTSQITTFNISLQVSNRYTSLYGSINIILTVKYTDEASIAQHFMALQVTTLHKKLHYTDLSGQHTFKFDAL